MKHILLAFALMLLAGCATNPGIDHRLVCTLEGKAAFATTYGPLAIFSAVPDANVICGTLTQTPAVHLTPSVIAPASAAKGTP